MAGARTRAAEASCGGAGKVVVVEERGRGVVGRGEGVRERGAEDGGEGVDGGLGALDRLRRVGRHRRQRLCRQEEEEE